MGRSRNKIYDTSYSHFVTMTVVDWLSIFANPELATIILDFFLVPKLCLGIDYIHNNPVRRGYVDEPWQRRYSSARNYEGKQGLVDVQTAW
jgi:hypothetical protein